jgi:hypothetical protein
LSSRTPSLTSHALHGSIFSARSGEVMIGSRQRDAALGSLQCKGYSWEGEYSIFWSISRVIR